MNIKKVAIGGLAGGIVSFLLGWLIYGMLLVDFMTTNYNQSINRPEADMIWWAMIAFNIIWGITYAYIFSRWANISTASTGAYAGAKLSLLIGSSVSLSFYAMTTMYSSLTTVFVEIAIGVVMGAIIGAVTGFVLGKIKD